MEPRPQQTQSLPGFDPEVHHTFSPESCESAGVVYRGCPKAASNHPLYIPFNDLELQHLPAEWRHQDTLQHIRDIGQRVVKLKVLKKSPDRPVDDPRHRRYGHTGSGFVTYESDQGSPVVHTNRHVVYDLYEASHTEVIFFYEGDSLGIKCVGSSQGFRCPMDGMDHSSFTLQQPLPEAVVTWQNSPMSSCQSDNQDRTKEAAARKAEKLDETFSWAGFADLTDTVVIISHPHGSRKQVSVGIMSMNSRRTFAHNVPACPGSSGAPLLTRRRMDNHSSPGRLNGLDIPEVVAGRFLHQGAYTSAQGTVSGVGAPRGDFTVSSNDGQHVSLLRTSTQITYRYQQWCMNTRERKAVLSQCILKLKDVFPTYVSFCIVGPPWTLAAFVLFLFYGFFVFMMEGTNLSIVVLIVMCLSLDCAAMHGVSELADVLVPPDDRGWLWTALLTLSHFLVVIILSPLLNELTYLAWSKGIHVVLRSDYRLVRWAETLASKLRPVKLHVLQRFTHLGEQGPNVERIKEFVCFLYTYGGFCILGPPWTPAALVVLLAFTIITVVTCGKEVRDVLSLAVSRALSLSLLLAAMHGVTELADVLVPPDDRGWLWTALLALLQYLIFFAILSVLRLQVLARSNRPRAMLRVEDRLERWAEPLVSKLRRLWRLYLMGLGEE